MSDNYDGQHTSAAEVELEALLRRSDEHVERALGARLDVDGRLSRVLSRGAAERTAAERVFNENSAAVLASWSVELRAAAVRTTSVRRRVVRAVVDPSFFAAAVGRARQGLEPWPDVILEIVDDASQQLVATLSLPSAPSAGVALVIDARLGSWASRELFVAAAAPSPDDAVPINLRASLTLPAMASSEELKDLTVALRVVGS